ncbi:MAG: hypothetical protein ACTSU9_07060 [Promethearchaeota archaeon]
MSDCGLANRFITNLDTFLDSVTFETVPTIINHGRGAGLQYETKFSEISSRATYKVIAKLYILPNSQKSFVHELRTVTDSTGTTSFEVTRRVMRIGYGGEVLLLDDPANPSDKTGRDIRLFLETTAKFMRDNDGTGPQCLFLKLHSADIFIQGDAKLDITMREESGTTKIAKFRYYLKGDNQRSLAISEGGYNTFFDNSAYFGPNSNLVKWQSHTDVKPTVDTNDKDVIIDGKEWYNDAVSNSHCKLQPTETNRIDKVIHVNEWYSLETGSTRSDTDFLTRFGDLYNGGDDSVLWSIQLEWYLKFLTDGARKHTTRELKDTLDQ